MLIAENLNTGASYEITDLTPTAGGYTKELLMADLLAMDGVSDGVYRFYARIVDDMFRGGMKVSNSLEPFKTVNAPVTLKSTQLTDMEGFVFQPVDKEQRIDLNAFIDNPDGDQLIYDLVCVSDRNYKVNWLIDKDDYLYITDCGDQTGEFMLELSVREPNGEPKTFAPFKLTVREHMIQYSSIPKVLIMSKPMSFQHAPEEAERIMPEAAGAGAKKHDKTLPGKTAEIPLEAFYFDGDGQAPVFSDFSFGALNGDAYRAEFDEATQTLRIFALGKGKDTLSFKVSDGFSTRTAQVEVEVITGKDEFIKTLIPYWWVLIVLAVIIFALIAAAALTRVKGNWDIKLELSNGDYAMGTFDIRHFTRSGKKKKFLLKELLLNNGLLNQMEVAERTQGSIDALLPGFFGPTTGADKIGMKGVLFGKGCTFYGLPANNAVTTVSVNGMIPRKKAVFKAGETVIDIAPPDDQSYNTLRITLDLH